MSDKKDAGDEQTQAGVAWDDSAMQTSFANVVNIQSTQEQVDLFFGTNQTWSVSGVGDQVKVELNHRVIMGPHAAKRLMLARWPNCAQALKQTRAIIRRGSIWHRRCTHRVTPRLPLTSCSRCSVRIASGMTAQRKRSCSQFLTR